MASGRRHRLAEGPAAVRIGQELGQGGGLECQLHLGDGLVQPLVERTQTRVVAGDAQGAGLDAADGIDRVHDGQDGDLRRVPDEGNAPSGPPLGAHQTLLGEPLEHLGQIGPRDLGGVRHLLGGAGARRLLRKKKRRPQGVLDRLGKHPQTPFRTDRGQPPTNGAQSRLGVIGCKGPIRWHGQPEPTGTQGLDPESGRIDGVSAPRSR